MTLVITGVKELHVGASDEGWNQSLKKRGWRVT